jgi:cation/acetate symporter
VTDAPLPGTVGSVGLNLSIFAAFVLVTLALVYRAGHTTRSTAEFYAAGRSLTGMQNGVAIAGDYLSAASFLGIAGAIAVNGYDGFLFSIGFLVAWLLALLLVAELLRNTGRYTMGDVLAYRMHQRPVRAAAAVSTLVVSSFYLLAQMAGAGGLIALLLQIPVTDRVGQGVVIAVVGGLMIVYVLVGGMTRCCCRACSTPTRSTSSRWGSRSCWARRACRTSSCASTPCPTPGRPATPWCGRSGSSASSTCSPSCSATAPRRCSRRGR